MSNEDYDTIVQKIKGKFDIPVNERSRQQRNAITRYYRNKDKYSLDDRGSLLFGMLTF